LKNNREAYFSQWKKFRFYLGGFLVILGFGILLLRNQIVFLLFGPEYEEVSSYLVYTAFLPFFKGMTNIHGWQGLYVIEKERTMAGITLVIGITTLSLLLWVLPKYGVGGVLAVRNLHEFLLMISTALFFNKLWKKEGI
jgi:O-antigen/teichoic acid export membrane protein